MKLESEKDGTSKIDSVIDAWASRFYLERATASNLTYLTDVFHYKQNGETLLDQDYQPRFGRSISSEEIDNRINRIFEKGKTFKRPSARSKDSKVEHLKSSPYWADLTMTLDSSLQTFDEIVAETYLWLEDEDIITDEEFQPKNLKKFIFKKDDFQDNYPENTFRIEEYYAPKQS